MEWVKRYFLSNSFQSVCNKYLIYCFSLYVHSSVAQWRRCLYSVKLRDSILNIV